MRMEGVVFRVRGRRMLVSTPDWGFVTLPAPREAPTIGERIWFELPARAMPRLWPKVALTTALLLLVGAPAFAWYAPVASVRITGQRHYDLSVDLLGRVSPLTPNGQGKRFAGEPVADVARAIARGWAAGSWRVEASGLGSQAIDRAVRAAIEQVQVPLPRNSVPTQGQGVGRQSTPSTPSGSRSATGSSETGASGIAPGATKPSGSGVPVVVKHSQTGSPTGSSSPTGGSAPASGGSVPQPSAGGPTPEAGAPQTSSPTTSSGTGATPPSSSGTGTPSAPTGGTSTQGSPPASGGSSTGW